MSQTEAKPSSSSPLWMGGALLAIVALLGTIGWFHRKDTKARGNLEQARLDYPEMLEMRKKIETLQKERGGGKKVAPRPDNPADFQKFFGDKRREQNIPDAAYAVKEPDREYSWPGWKEYPYTITLGRRESLIPRTNFINFVAAIERERPYLKSREIEVNFDEATKNIWGTIIISDFKAESGK